MTKGIIACYEYGNRDKKREYYQGELLGILQTTYEKDKATELPYCEGAIEWLQENYSDYEYIILPSK